MVQKTIGLYNDATPHSPFNEDTLVIEIGLLHVACFVKSTKENTVSAFEFYKIEVDGNDWQDIFYEIRTNSGLLDKNYSATNVFYNFEETVLVPGFKFYAGTVGNFISLIYGENENDVVKFDALTINEERIYNAYRINSSLHETVQRNFLAINEYHSYTSLLLDHFDRKEKAPDALHVSFYDEKLVVIVVKQTKLQLVQSFHYETKEDVLYYLLNIAKQFKMMPEFDLLTIAGFVEEGGKIPSLLKSYFGNVIFYQLDSNATSLEKFATHPAHFFTSIIKLSA